jgi:hypothetical protein
VKGPRRRASAENNRRQIRPDSARFGPIHSRPNSNEIFTSKFRRQTIPLPNQSRFGTRTSYVIFGGASLPASIDLANLGNAGITILGADANDRSGRSVSSGGEVNGDGFDVNIIGA